MPMRLTPEYEPVQKLYLSFVQEFFNSRFHYGRAICEIIKSVQNHVAIELLIGTHDLEHFREECARYQVTLQNVTLNHDTPGRGIMAEYAPIFAGDEQGKDIGLVFRNPFLENSAELERFSRRLVAANGFRVLDMGFEFSTAHLLVNEEVVLLSDRLFKEEDRDAKLSFLSDRFPAQGFYVIPPLAGDVTRDLDMYLWPIAPKVWIVSEYPSHTPQADSVQPALKTLAAHGHTVHRVPGLGPIVRDDVNTVPNYANGAIINQAALVPAYQLKEDDVASRILRDYGYEVFPIDCSNVILSNAGVHCMSRTVPAGRGTYPKVLRPQMPASHADAAL
jgi:hypothetical protein